MRDECSELQVARALAEVTSRLTSAHDLLESLRSCDRQLVVDYARTMADSRLLGPDCLEEIRTALANQTVWDIEKLRGMAQQDARRLAQMTFDGRVREPEDATAQSVCEIAYRELQHLPGSMSPEALDAIRRITAMLGRTAIKSAAPC